jgi:hypothetical protein
MRKELEVMAGQNQLSDWVDVTSIASQMTSASIAVAVVWSSGMISDQQFSASMQFSTGLVLLGVARGRVRKNLEERVKIAQNALTQQPATRQSQINN